MSAASETGFRRLTPRALVATLLALAALLAFSAAIGLFVGATGVGWPSDQIVLGARLPRVLLAAVVGAALSSAGVAFQGLLRNPLADPFILGVSGGAAVGAVATILFGAAARAAAPVAAFAGAAASTGLVYALARGRLGMSGERLLLTGVVVNAFLSAVLLLLNQLAPPTRRIDIFAWMTGNLGVLGAGGTEVALVAAAALGGAAVFVALARDLDLLSVGESTAAALGVEVGRTRAALFFAGSLVTGAAVSVSGLIGFVGLIVPHALRLALGPDHRRLVPAAFLGGAAFLVLADTASRVLSEELPVGVVTALCGGPFFLYLLATRHRPGAGPFGGAP